MYIYIYVYICVCVYIHIYIYIYKLCMSCTNVKYIYKKTKRAIPKVPDVTLEG